MNDIWEVSNVFRTNVSKRRINRKNKQTKITLEKQAMTICKDELSERYIHNSFSKFDGGFIYYDMDGDEILSFCLWKKYEVKQEKQLHILLLCAKYPEYSLGSTMINDIEQYCFENKLNILSVSPATEALTGYYQKFGFIKDEKEPSRMIKYLTLLNIKKRKKTRKLPVLKREYPMVASMMPYNLNTTKHQSF
jgi:hypothetical protein